MEKRGYVLLGFVFLIFGIFFLLNSKINITGAFVGTTITPALSSFFSILFFFISGILFVVGRPDSEKKIRITSAIGKDKGLVQLAKEATRNQQVQGGIDHLISELSKGSLKAGLGKLRHIEGTDVDYMGTRGGARLYFHRIDKNTFEIVGKSAKGSNQNKVMRRLRKIYS